MAAAINITIKKNDGTTDIVWTVLSGSAGDKLPASWRSETSATMRGNRATISLTAQDNGAKTARRTNVKAIFPIPRVVNSVEVVSDKIVGDFSLLIPNALTDAEINEAVSQMINLLSHADFRAQFKSGIAAN